MSNRPHNRPISPGGKPDQKRVAEMLRVDHAGEYAAVAIYKAQQRVFARSPKKQKIAAQLQHMQDEEQMHLDAFDDLLRDTDTRPTAFMPVWGFASKTLGIATALMGEKAAHACTEAVETVIEEHYAKQIEETKDSHPELCAQFTKFREDELAHRDMAVDGGAKDALGYPLLSAVIKTGCRAAIKISEKF
jgi:ubiquinone biosynthesis monooxygenase Coq7